MQDFKKLVVWQKAHELTLAIYRHSTGFPDAERYGLTSQLRRGASSVAANIAEGCGRGGGADFVRFLRIAAGSASETEYHILLARDLNLLQPETHDQLTADIQEIKRMLTGLIRRLNSDN